MSGDQPDVATVLQRLVLQAEEGMRGRGYHRLDVIEQQRELAINIERHVRMPCDGERVAQDYALLLIQALQKIEAARDSRDSICERVWLQIAGVLLPVVRADFARALEMRRK